MTVGVDALLVSIHIHNADPAIIDDYRAIDPVDFFRDAMLAKPGTTINLYDLISRRDYVRTGLYTRYGRKHRLEAVTGTVCVEPISLRMSLQADKRVAAPSTDGARPWALVSVDDGCLVEVDAAFVALVRREWPNWTTAKLPDELRRCFLACETFHGRQLSIQVSDADDRRLLVAHPRHPGTGMGAREAEVLRRYVRGDTYKEIARELGTSPATVRNQLARLYRRFDVHDKVELVRAVEAAGPLDAPVAAPVPVPSPMLPLDAILRGDVEPELPQGSSSGPGVRRPDPRSPGEPRGRRRGA